MRSRAPSCNQLYSLIDQAVVGVAVASCSSVVAYDFLRRTKWIFRASSENGLDVVTGKQGDHEAVP